MLLVTWNVAGRVRRRAEQVRALEAVEADVVALQEVTPTTLEAWAADLDERGYAVRTSLDRPRSRASGRRTLGVLVAARGRLRPGPRVEVPWPERLLAVNVDGIQLYNLHSPISPSPRLAKVRTHETLHAHLARRARAPRILCGDLNTPRQESPNGEVMTFARDRHGRLRPERGERWDRAELSLVLGLEEHGFRDAFRSLHGYGRREISWAWRRWPGGYRLDHVIVSRGIEVRECEYLHEWREVGLSDHSGMLARLEVGSGG